MSTCRICKENEMNTSKGPMMHSCTCTDRSHRDCLITWIKIRKNRYCDVCHTPYAMKPLPFLAQLVLDFSPPTVWDFFWVCAFYTFFSWMNFAGHRYWSTVGFTWWAIWEHIRYVRSSFSCISFFITGLRSAYFAYSTPRDNNPPDLPVLVSDACLGLMFAYLSSMGYTDRIEPLAQICFVFALFNVGLSDRYAHLVVMCAPIELLDRPDQ